MKIFTMVLLGGAALVAIPLISAGSGLFSSLTKSISAATSAPGRVIQKTLDTDNIINNYEYFHNAHGRYKTLVRQVDDVTSELTGLPPAEASYRRVEVMAVKQTCRDLANQYNANATKTNRSIFMGKEAPEKLDAAKCDGTPKS